MSSAGKHSAIVFLRMAGVVLLCAITGSAIGVAVAFRATEVKITRYANRLLQYAETFTNEINTTLDAVNASPYPFCSDEDIARLWCSRDIW
jgi:hypothetical protein